MKEKCVSCGKETECDTSTPIIARLNFIEGSGQLCSECWRKLYFKENENCEHTRLSQRGADKQDKYSDTDAYFGPRAHVARAFSPPLTEI